MFQKISWYTYLIAFALVAGAYYGIVLPLFFKQQIRRFFSGQRSPSRESSSAAVSTGIDDYTTYEKLRDEITAYLEGEEVDAGKPDILFSLRVIINRNPPLEDERFRGALGKEIRRLYNERYNDSLSGEEVEGIWTE